jgi:hypothetical protein
VKDYGLIATTRAKKVLKEKMLWWVVNRLGKVDMPGLVMVKLIKVAKIGEVEMA